MRLFTFLSFVSLILIPFDCYRLQNAENNNNRKATEGYRHLIYPGKRNNKDHVFKDSTKKLIVNSGAKSESVYDKNDEDLFSSQLKQNEYAERKISDRRYNSIEDDEDDFPMRPREDEVDERRDDAGDSSSDDKIKDARDLDNAKRQMLDEIRNIRRVLRKKIEMYFRSVYPRFRKADMCFGNMANGVNFNSMNYFTHDWRKIIRGALSMAGNVVKTALGPFAGPSKVALKGLANMSDYIGRKKDRIEDFLPSTSLPLPVRISTRNPWAKLDSPIVNAPNQPYIENVQSNRAYIGVPNEPYIENQSHFKFSGRVQKKMKHKLHTIQLDIKQLPYFYSNALFGDGNDYYTHQVFERFIQEFCDEDEEIMGLREHLK